jgi:hypothetical protein
MEILIFKKKVFFLNKKKMRNLTKQIFYYTENNIKGWDLQTIKSITQFLCNIILPECLKLSINLRIMFKEVKIDKYKGDSSS